jgi:dUTP pyrophosphatase
MEIKVTKKHENVVLPEYATEGAAGFDLIADSFLQLYNIHIPISFDEKLKYSIQKGYLVLRPNERLLVGTGLFMQIPQGYELQIRDRSGLSLKKGLKVFNAPGTIDSDYRGEIGVILANLSDGLVKVQLGERIAQGIIAKYEKVNFELATLSNTERGDKGFGSTGV